MKTLIYNLQMIVLLLVFGAAVLVLPFGHPWLGKIAKVSHTLT